KSPPAGWQRPSPRRALDQRPGHGRLRRNHLNETGEGLMTQQQREAIAGRLRASPFDPAGDLREQRPLFDKMVAAAPVPADVVTTPGQLGGVPVISVDIPGTTTGGVILYLHDGFFAIGSAATSVGLASDLARKARMPVVTVDYRL